MKKCVKILSIVLFAVFLMLGSKNVYAANAKIYSLTVSGYPDGTHDRELMHDRINSTRLPGYSIGSSKEFIFDATTVGKGTDKNGFNNAVIEACEGSSSSNDIFILYFSGHSSGDVGIAMSGNYYYDEKTGKTVYKTDAYKWKDLAHILSAYFPKGKIVVILDCCHSEKFYTVGVKSLSSTETKRFHCLLSSAEKETSGVHFNKPYGQMTYAIGLGLGYWNGDVAAANSKGIVTLLNLYKYAKFNARGTGLFLQTIKIYGSDISLFRYPVAFNESNIYLYKGQTKTVTPYVGGSKVLGKWKSSNSSVASVNSKGKIIAKKKGTATITVTVKGISANCKVTVKENSIKLNKSSLSLNVGQSSSLNATVEGKANKVTWKSNNKFVATVSSSGKVTAKRKGTATITATANGKTAKCTVNVVKKVTDISFVMNKKLADAAAYLGFRRALSYDPGAHRLYTDIYTYVMSTEIMYNAGGKYPLSGSYIIGESAEKNAKGKWNAVIRDKSLSIYGVKVGMTAGEADKKLKANGWHLTYDGFNYGYSSRMYNKSGAIIGISFKKNVIDQIGYNWIMEREFA